MRKIEKLKKALKDLLIEFRSVNTDKAVLSWDGEDDIAEGVAVYVVDEEGKTTIPEDGEYIDENKTRYVIENGIVKEIVTVSEQPEEQPEAPAEEPAMEEPEEPVEEPVEEEPKEEEQPEEEPAEEEPVEEPVEEPAEEPVEETPVEEVEEVAEEANELANRVDELVEKIAKLEEEIEALKAFKSTVEAMSAGKPAQQEFREVIDNSRSKDKELQTISKFFN
jgi:outer membrane biosynthesis protein TonB